MDEAKSSLVLLFTSPPGSERVRYGLDAARRSSEQGKDVSVVLMQDAVLLGLDNSPHAQAFDKIPKVFALEDHLKRRGFSAESLRANVGTIGYEGVVKLVMSDNASVVGSL